MSAIDMSKRRFMDGDELTTTTEVVETKSPLKKRMAEVLGAVLPTASERGIIEKLGEHLPENAARDALFCRYESHIDQLLEDERIGEALDFLKEALQRKTFLINHTRSLYRVINLARRRLPYTVELLAFMIKNNTMQNTVDVQLGCVKLSTHTNMKAVDPFCYAVYWHQYVPEALELMLEHRGVVMRDYDRMTHEGVSPLTIAVERKNFPLFVRLIKEGYSEGCTLALCEILRNPTYSRAVFGYSRNVVQFFRQLVDIEKAQPQRHLLNVGTRYLMQAVADCRHFKNLVSELWQWQPMFFYQPAMKGEEKFGSGSSNTGGIMASLNHNIVDIFLWSMHLPFLLEHHNSLQICMSSLERVAESSMSERARFHAMLNYIGTHPVELAQFKRHFSCANFKHHVMPWVVDELYWAAGVDVADWCMNAGGCIEWGRMYKCTVQALLFHGLEDHDVAYESLERAANSPQWSGRRTIFPDVLQSYTNNRRLVAIYAVHRVLLKLRLSVLQCKTKRLSADAVQAIVAWSLPMCFLEQLVADDLLEVYRWVVVQKSTPRACEQQIGTFGQFAKAQADGIKDDTVPLPLAV